MYCFVHADHLTWYKSLAACAEVQISQVLIIFSHISHHEGVFIQPEGLVYILGFVCFIFFDNGCEELNAVTS